jgi:hypothetical protein
MKNSIAFFALILLSSGLFAMAGNKSVSYVKTGNEIIFGQDLKIGMFNYKVIVSDGVVKKIPVRDVVAYSHNSQIFEYLPVMCESNRVVCHAMMELVSVKSGLNLYRYTCYLGETPRYEYFIFKNGDFYLRIDQKNARTTLPFFGIKVV